MFKPELLSPAGSLKHMRYAFAYGADAVYAGLPRYSLRVRNNSFNLENLRLGIQEAQAQNKQFFVAVNIAPHNSKIKTFLKDIEPIIAMKPDALIMSDPGLMMMVREKWPEAIIHLSVQANTVNYAAVKFWQSQGIKRVILSRELSLEEVAEIRQQCPDIELEVFVHGALCIAYSGRCLLSGYFNHRDPNQGTCTNACRWGYDVHRADQNENGDVLLHQPLPQLGKGATSDQLVLLEEKQRPGDLMPMYEDEHGTYIFNSKDLRAIQHVEKLMEIGVDCLKIEGRTKSYFYAARTAQVYRQAIDDAAKGAPFDMRLMDTLQGMANRGYTEGFFRRHVHDDYQNYLTGSPQKHHQLFVGEVIDSRENALLIDVKNRFQIGDQLIYMSPDGEQSMTLSQMTNQRGEAMVVAPGSGHQVWIDKPGNYKSNYQSNYGLIVKNGAID
ncbi:tRNA 5-hydroxyuridine modification protein YegQ [Aliikangiella coralliicola]|uniref:U32 family peptidase n=1 Tax=Aliikangiella coralliicola TaxID=2592383 RepID=A0A545UDI5_9GAMM|nr:tRNA 5-hydroxyuridine modification protein YegQ [Aliikangiella coralliicola]TQV87527.1 U32 family peptidase [Aliikangiella coralliicola]